MSCSDLLDETPKDFLTPGNAFTKPDYIEQGIAGLHQQIRPWWTNNEAQTTIMFTCGTDLSFNGENPGSGVMADYVSALSPTAGSGPYWNKFYGLVQKANVLIESINVMDESAWTNQEEKDALLSEVLFLRAFAYRNLVVLFGDIPLVTEVIDYAKTDFVRAPKADIHKLMEDDLKFAVQHLPVRGAEKAKGRITQGAAWHLLSETYLIEGKYQDAVDAASHVIDNAGYALMKNRFGTKLGKDIFGTGDPYYDLFGYGNQNLSENTEAVWVIQVEPDVVGGDSYASERMYGAAYYRMGNTPDGFLAFRGEFYNGAYTGYTDTLGRPVSWNRPTSYVLYNIWGNGNWDKDLRNAEHNLKRHYYFDNPNSIYDGQLIDWSLYAPGQRANPMMDTIQYIFPYFMKVASPMEHFTDLGRSGGGTTHKDVYAIRLAETYLIRAEAYLGLNKKDKAADDINEIRNRAQAIPVTPDEVTIDYILDERARELYSEEWRTITLIRLGKLVERVRKYNDNPMHPGLNIQDYHNLWPIPQTEIDRNKDAELIQNPGYR
ncbi:membrane protein [Bacteroidia bacterium]|nr:membrane protein [Bacteroidia bacterium]